MRQLAFVLYKYFPFGGLQRDFLRIALECQQRGCKIRVYCMSWQGEIPAGFDVRILPAKALFNHVKYARFQRLWQQDVAQEPVDLVIGFNKMPGLDFYYAADACYEDKARHGRNFAYRLGGRYLHFAAYERAVFAADSNTQILLISALQQPLFERYYQTPQQRFHLLPPGIGRDRRAPENAAEVRAQFRQEFNLQDDDLLLVQIGSGFKTKGLDRTLKAVAALPTDLRKRTRLIVIGQDEQRPFLVQIKALGIAKQVTILKGRDDIPRFLLGADVLIHPAYNENTGTVLLEALVAGLPVLVTDICGYAHYIAEANCGVVLPSPFNQSQLEQQLSKMLQEPQQRQQWQANGLDYAEHADLYSMPERAAEIILAG